jgi:hypothetical protein
MEKFLESVVTVLGNGGVCLAPLVGKLALQVRNLSGRSLRVSLVNSGTETSVTLFDEPSRRAGEASTITELSGQTEEFLHSE